MHKKTIPPKNYAILFGVIVLIICACFASFNLYSIYKDNKISASPLAKTEVGYDDLKNTTSEMNADAFLVISYLYDEKVHANESQIRKLLNRKNLLDNVMYLDITEEKNDETFINELNKTLSLKDKLRIEQFPAVVYYKEGVPAVTMDSKDHLLNADDFEQIIDMYQLAS